MLPDLFIFSLSFQYVAVVVYFIFFTSYKEFFQNSELDSVKCHWSFFFLLHFSLCIDRRNGKNSFFYWKLLVPVFFSEKFPDRKIIYERKKDSFRKSFSHSKTLLLLLWNWILFLFVKIFLWWSFWLSSIQNAKCRIVWMKNQRMNGKTCWKVFSFFIGQNKLANFKVFWNHFRSRFFFYSKNIDHYIQERKNFFKVKEEKKFSANKQTIFHLKLTFDKKKSDKI